VREVALNAGYHCGATAVKPELLLCAHGLDVMGIMSRGIVQVSASLVPAAGLMFAVAASASEV
jgi:hypothetical protein